MRLGGIPVRLRTQLIETAILLPLRSNGPLSSVFRRQGHQAYMGTERGMSTLPGRCAGSNGEERGAVSWLVDGRLDGTSLAFDPRPPLSLDITHGWPYFTSAQNVLRKGFAT